MVPRLDLAPCRKYTEDPEGVMAKHIGSSEDSDGFGDGDADISSPIHINQAKKNGMTRLYSARLGEMDEGPLTPLKNNLFPQPAEQSNPMSHRQTYKK